MIEILLCATVVLLVIVVVMQIFTLRRKVGIDLTPVQQAFERTERLVREEIGKNREEATNAARTAREELGNSLKSMGDTLNQQIASLTQSNDQKLERVRETVEQRLTAIQKDSGDKLEQVRQDALATAKALREEIGTTLKSFNETLVNNIGEMGKLQKAQLDVFSERLDKLTQSNEQKLNTMRETVEQRLTAIQKDSGEKLDQIRLESGTAAQKAREEVTTALKTFGESTAKTLTEMGANQRSQLISVVEQLTKLTEATEKKLEAQRVAVDERLKQIQTDSAASAKSLREEVLKGMTGMAEAQQKQMATFSEQLIKLTEAIQLKLDALKTAVEEKLKAIQEDNTKQLDQMRATVDEKLQGTLEKRLGESFKQVSERLEQVYKGLGEMQVLATGVGDLKKVLTNVKTRGTWGEVQLGALLEQVLTPEQFATNVVTKDGGGPVEYAVKLPGRGEDKEEPLWLPIDAKFPVEDYQRLVEAQEKADPEGAEAAAKQLEIRIKLCAKDIHDKYINPPNTPDFGILFLPTEGLYAEVVRRISLTDYVQRECHVMIAGPTTLMALLNSLQMGFRTLAIQKRSGEVWNLLAAVKTEWTKYGAVLEKVQKKLQEATNTVDEAAKRTRVIGRKLRDVQELPAAEAGSVLLMEGVGSDGEAQAEDAEA